MVDHHVFKYQVDQSRYFLEHPAHFRTITRIQSALCQVYGIRQEYAAVEFEKVMGRWLELEGRFDKAPWPWGTTEIQHRTRKSVAKVF